MTAVQPCPICLLAGATVTPRQGRDAVRVVCIGCGDHDLTHHAARGLKQTADKPAVQAFIAHSVYKRPTGDCIEDSWLIDVEKVAQALSASECRDNLLLHFAKNWAPGEVAERSASHLQAPIGAVSAQSAMWVVQEAIAAGLLRCVIPQAFDSEVKARSLVMTWAGWEHIERLKRNGAGSRHAFMAMDFNHPWLWDFFHDHLQPAVERTGFDLRTTNHPGKVAGLIDNSMRVDVHTARFVVCDLTHSNRGAYWEAGFAEGIGRPVFYICRRAERESKDKATAPHFDTAHQHIIVWDQADPGPAMRELVDMIRATLPDEAKMQDPKD